MAKREAFGLDLGIFTEGTLVKNAAGRLELHTSGQVLDVLASLEGYLGKEVRVIVTPMDTVHELALKLEE